jgi:hypothetical protein
LAGLVFEIMLALVVLLHKTAPATGVYGGTQPGGNSAAGQAIGDQARPPVIRFQPAQSSRTQAIVHTAAIPAGSKSGPESASGPTEKPAQPAGVPRSPIGANVPPGVDLLLSSDAPVEGILDGRQADYRGTLAARGGGNSASERAVEQGLRWLVAHQSENGSWHFDFEGSMCHGQCRNPGSVRTITGATALALLPFLGAGYTHRSGEYQDNVSRALYYLNSRAQLTANGSDLRDGTLYSQALSGIALCEAYAMTGDHQLQGFAQSVLDYIVYAQDKNGGGWRYEPGMPGDMTVTGWQLMALKCGQMAKLKVPSASIYLVTRFLDHVQAESGARYGYMTPVPKPTTTSIGLLSRMYTGWRREHPALIAGIGHLTQWGPSADDIYYDYYATQAIHHWEGPEWDAWNAKMRDFLVRAQATAGHEAGSWYFRGGHGDKGGRLYNTAMAIMTLEVYYRYLPLYSHDSTHPF